MVDWYYNYITHRNIFVDINGAQVCSSLSIGFPQGGVCSAKFWIIAFNHALYLLNEHGVLGISFADDCVALIGETNLNHMMSRVQKVVSNLEEWGLSCGLTFNAGKTEVIIFTKKSLAEDQKPNQLVVNYAPVPFATSAKYLGITLNHKLTWNTHFASQIAKCKRYLHMLQKSVKKPWGPKPTYIRWIYNAIVRPKLVYAALSWGHITRFPSKYQQLDKLNSFAADLITPVRCSTPVKTMEILYNLVPLHLFIKYEALASLTRNTHCTSLSWQGCNPKCKTYIGHRKYWYDALRIAHLSIRTLDKISLLQWSRHFYIDLLSLNQTQHPPKSQINVYTDGSKTDHHTDSGFVIYKEGIKIAEGARRLSSQTTIFQAEIMAIQMATQALLSLLTEGDRYIKFFTDSQASVLALHKRTSPLKWLKTLLTNSISWVFAPPDSLFLGLRRTLEIRATRGQTNLPAPVPCFPLSLIHI